MKKLMILLFTSLSIIACQNKPRKIAEYQASEQTNILRGKIKKYTDSLQTNGGLGLVVINYFQAFNRETANSRYNEDAFKNVNIIDSNTVEVSRSIIASQDLYEKNKLGQVINSVGLHLKYDNYGNILSHTGYVLFESKNPDYTLIDETNQNLLPDLLKIK